MASSTVDLASRFTLVAIIIGLGASYGGLRGFLSVLCDLGGEKALNRKGR